MNASRRDFLIGAASLATAAISRESLYAAQAQAGQAWNAGDVAHLLPAATHDRFLIKTSFRTPHRTPLVLLAAGRKIPGRAGDTLGFFWSFDVTGLEPAHRYNLQVVDARGRPLCDPWPLSTLPAPGDNPKSVRLLIYSCAGGHDILPDHQPTEISTHRFLTLAVRRRMLERAMSFNPDVVVANGDHIYWDLFSARANLLGMSPAAKAYAGVFDRTLPVLGTANEQVLKKAVGPQIADLYGTMMRSTPVCFLQDDHDYFETDEADDTFVTMPPDAFMLNLARASQLLYYPEFLPDAHRGAGLPSGSAADRPAGVSESFGTLRYGRLLEMLLYDCRRYMTMNGPSAVFVPPIIEDWLKARMAGSDAIHVVNMPSIPPGWSAGKWGEWYADMDGGNQRLTTKIPKPYWQPGWRSQHDRLFQAASAMRSRIPLFISGDLHSLGEMRVFKTGDINLRSNPVVSVLPGTVGTGRPGWPSLVRGLRGLPPEGLEVEEGLPALEENGFTIADFTPARVTLRYFRWKLGQPESVLDTLEPFRTTNLMVPA
ncbi:MAG TPA: hypothetical protein VL914_00800 [Vicinamibacterales bacterium]|nr:hypothetical protein [Vicinamibacterales bacterium]